MMQSNGIKKLLVTGIFIMSLMVSCNSSDDDPGGNQPPTVSAGDDQSITLPDNEIQLSGVVDDDGLPSGSVLQITWSATSGPAEVVFDNENEAQNQARFSEAGTYVLTLTADDGELSASDSMTVTVNGSEDDGAFQDVSIQRSITHVQPMSGIVFWTDSDHNQSDAIQLEYSYMKYGDIVQQEGQYDWQPVDDLLDQVASRSHQAVLRFYYVYPGDSTTVPQYIKDSSGYSETSGQSEGLTTWFPDWSFDALKEFTLAFFTQFAQRYDDDPRIAFFQVGFGLWAEYHIYDGPMELGRTFPSKSFQAEFFQHMDAAFDDLPWAVSIDAADSDRTPFADQPALLDAHFGLFDDSFLRETHDGYNAECFRFFGFQDRYQYAPMGGELSYSGSYDQQHALDPEGPYGISFEQMAAQYYISYMIGNDQPDYQSMTRIKEAGMATGYKFKVTSFKASSDAARVVVENTGIAPIYTDAYVAVNGVRSSTSLKGLLPGQSRQFSVSSGGSAPELTIECDRLVSGQSIEFEADL